MTQVFKLNLSSQFISGTISMHVQSTSLANGVLLCLMRDSKYAFQAKTATTKNAAGYILSAH